MPKCLSESERGRFTLRSVNQQSLKALICANFYGPIGGLAQHGRSYSVKVKCFVVTHVAISKWALQSHNCGPTKAPHTNKQTKKQKKHFETDNLSSNPYFG